jgi:hypothetical protein
VVDTLPLRTMSCLCLPGYVGDADVECKLGKTFLSILASNRSTDVNALFLQDNNPIFPTILLKTCLTATLLLTALQNIHSFKLISIL